MHRASVLSLALIFAPAPVLAQGAPLGPEFRANTYTIGRQADASVAADALGNFVVAWDSNGQDGSSFGVFAQRFDAAGAPLGPEFRVNTYTTGSQVAPKAASDAAGNFVIVWRSNGQDGFNYGVFGQRYSGSGVPLGPEFRVNTSTGGQEVLGSVASDPSGNFVVIWNLQGFAIFGQRYAAGGAPLGPEFRVNAFTTGCPHSPDVASDAAGNFVVAWQDKIRAGGSCPFPTVGVLARRFAATGAPLGVDFQVNTSTGGYQSQVAAAADAAGDLVIAWFSTHSGPARIYAQRYDPAGGPAGAEFQVNSSTGQAFDPAVRMDDPGNFVVAWTAAPQDGSGYGVFGQRFVGNGAPSGTEFRVNTYTTGNQAAPTVTADGVGRFVVAWTSAGEDGSMEGVFAQRFGLIFPVELMDYGVE